MSNDAVVLPSFELQMRRVWLKSGISRPADETSRPIRFPIRRVLDKVLSCVQMVQPLPVLGCRGYVLVLPGIVSACGYS